MKPRQNGVHFWWRSTCCWRLH